MYSRFLNNLLVLAARVGSTRGAVIAALLIALPTVFSGFTLDDYYHLATLDGAGQGPTPSDLFVFGTGDAEQTGSLMASGVFPWYTLPELKIHFFRPLSSMLFWLDYALFGRHAVFYHLHSMAWYAFLAFAVAALYRRVLPGPVACLALLLYLLDDGHLGPVQWLSNRNALVSVVPALLGFLAHMRWREEGWRPGLPLSLLGYTIGFLGGETALGISGFLFAYEMIGRRGPLLARLAALAPAGALSVAYLAAYKWGGYGVSGSGVYLDPVGNWRGFLAEAPGRFLDLVGVQFFKLPVETIFFSNGGSLAFLLRFIGLAAVLVLMLAARQVWCRLTPEERRALAWLCVGSAIAALPALAAYPSGRLLLLPSLGACALVGTLIWHGAGSARAAAGRLSQAVARVFSVLHVVYPALMWGSRGVVMLAAALVSEGAFHVAELDRGDLSEDTVITLQSPDMYTGVYSVAIRRELGLPRAKSWQSLSQAQYDHEVIRTGENRFEVKVLGGEILSLPVEQFFRSAEFAMRAGDAVDLGGYRIDILEAGSSGPSRLAVTMDRPLESPDYHFLAWDGGTLKPFRWPPVGQPLVLSPGEGYFFPPHVYGHIGEVVAELTGRGAPTAAQAPGTEGGR